MTEIQKIQLTELEADMAQGSPVFRGRLDLVGDLKVGVTALLGGAEISISKLFNLKEGDLLELDNPVNQPVELQLNGKAIAFGEIVVVGDQFGLRITQAPQK